MMPQAGTVAEVTSVAATTMATRNGPVATPSARASSSGSDMTFMRQRSATSTAVPITTGPASGTRSAAGGAARLPSSQNVMAGSGVVGAGQELHHPAPAPQGAPADTPARPPPPTGTAGRGRGPEPQQ